MSSSTPGGPGPTEPNLPPSTGPTGQEPEAPYTDIWVNSPFGKMFTAAGATPTAKEMQQIINEILKNILDQMKRAEAEQKKADEELKKALRDED